MIVLNKVSRQSITVVRVTGIQRSILLANLLIPGYDDPESALEKLWLENSSHHELVAKQDADAASYWDNELAGF